MPDNVSKLTPENVNAFVTGLQNGDLQKQISKDTGISGPTLSIWKRRALSDEPLTGHYLPLQLLREFLLGNYKEPEQRELRAKLLETVMTDRVTTTERVTEVIKLTPSQRKALGEELSSAFEAGEAVLLRKVTTTKTESPDPIAVIKTYQLLFPEDEKSAGDT